MEPVEISVLVSTHNRAEHIEACLESIVAALQQAYIRAAELIVVNNASTDATTCALHRFQANSAYPVVVLQEPRKGLSMARNRAVSAARGKVLVFTDDDCRMSVTYFAALLRHHAQDRAQDRTPVLRGGRVELGRSADLPISIKRGDHRQTLSVQARSSRHDAVGRIIIGCNMTMTRAAAMTIGRFDERLGAGTRIPAAEDHDFLLRGYLRGFAIEYVPDMVVFHHHGRDRSQDAVRFARNFALGDGAVYLKHMLADANTLRPILWELRTAWRDKGRGLRGPALQPPIATRTKLALHLWGAILYAVGRGVDGARAALRPPAARRPSAGAPPLESEDTLRLPQSASARTTQ